jgi:hypothetical protein
MKTPKMHPAANERRHGPRKARVMWADAHLFYKTTKLCCVYDFHESGENLPVLVLPLDPASLAALEERMAEKIAEHVYVYGCNPEKAARAVLGTIAKELVRKERK